MTACVIFHHLRLIACSFLWGKIRCALKKLSIQLFFLNCGSLKIRKAKLHNVGKCVECRDATMFFWWHSFRLCSLAEIFTLITAVFCYSSYLSFVYKSTFLNYYFYAILIRPHSMNELGGGLAQWMSWLAFTLVAKELSFDSQPGQEISLFSHV